MERCTFTQLTGAALAGSLLTNNVLAPAKKKRVAVVGTGHRGMGMGGAN